MKFYGLRVYDMEESIVASGFPMLKNKYTPEEYEWEVQNLNYWLDTDVMKFLFEQERDRKNNRKSPNVIELFDDRAELITNDENGIENGRFIIDHESVPKIIGFKWSYSKGYCRNHVNGVSLHRFIALEEEELEDTSVFIDHINKNTFDNRLCNLRKADNTDNVRNSSLRKNNSSGITGVNFRKDRNKWRSFIMVDKKQIALGLYDDINDAIRARLEGELKYFGEFAPQIDLFEKYGVQAPAITNLSKNKKKYNLNRAWKHFKRACNLGNATPGSGHDCLQKGIVVSVNIEADQSFWLQWERYHFQDTVSSMSTMHCLCKFEKVEEMFSKYTDPRSISILNEKIEAYNNNPTSENFHQVIHNCPQGIELCRRLVTNYLQIKSMLGQRKNHKMESWREGFVELTQQLPFFEEMTQKTK